MNLRGTLYIKMGGEFVEVAPCTVNVEDGGVFTTKEYDRERVKGTNKRITFERIGTLPRDAHEDLKDEVEAARAAREF